MNKKENQGQCLIQLFYSLTRTRKKIKFLCKTLSLYAFCFEWNYCDGLPICLNSAKRKPSFIFPLFFPPFTSVRWMSYEDLFRVDKIESEKFPLLALSPSDFVEFNRFLHLRRCRSFVQATETQQDRFLFDTKRRAVTSPKNHSGECLLTNDLIKCNVRL